MTQPAAVLYLQFHRRQSQYTDKTKKKLSEYKNTVKQAVHDLVANRRVQVIKQAVKKLM